jgi:hypothetical protein
MLNVGKSIKLLLISSKILNELVVTYKRRWLDFANHVPSSTIVFLTLNPWGKRGFGEAFIF